MKQRDSRDRVPFDVRALKLLSILQLLVSLLAVIAAGLLIHEHRNGAAQTRASLLAQNQRDVAAFSEHLEHYFDAVHSELLAIRLDPGIAALRPGEYSHLQRLFDQLWLDQRLSEIYVLRADFDGERRPLVTFERAIDPVDVPELHSLDREQEEYALLVEQIARFRHNPELDRQLDGEITLCLPDPKMRRASEVPGAQGLIYSIPIRQEGELLGAVAAMIPSSRLESEFTPIQEGSVQILLQLGGAVFSSMPLRAGQQEALLSAVNSGRVAESGASPVVLSGQGQWRYLQKKIDIEADDSWYALLFYDEEVQARILGLASLGLAWGGPIAAVCIGLALVVLLGFARSRLRSKAMMFEERARRQDMLASMVRATSPVTGERFFETLVRNLSAAAQVRYVLVGRLVGTSRERVETVAVWAGDGLAANIEYDLAGTPCENVVGQSACSYPRDVQRLFPEDHLLVEMGVESYHGTPLFDAAGEPVGILALLDDKAMPRTTSGVAELVDIAASRAAAEIERLRADERVQRSENRYRFLVEEQNDLVVRFGADGVLSYASPTYCRLFGKTEDELLGSSFVPLIHPEDRESVGESLDSLKYPPHKSEHDERALTAHGWRWLSWSARGVVDSDGNVESIVSVGRDISDRKELEGQQLQTRVTESIATLAGGVSHDVNNVLTTILSIGRWLGEQMPADDPRQEEIRELVGAARRGGALTRNLLGYARQRKQRRQDVDINRVVGKAVSTMGRIVAKHVELDVELAQDLPPLRGDRQQLEQVLVNLCLNAFDAVGNSGHITITTALCELTDDSTKPSPRLENGRFICLVVADDGSGMDAQTLRRAFEPFFYD